jgi:tetratricopeptide (TPR) repeat protein
VRPGEPRSDRDRGLELHARARILRAAGEPLRARRLCVRALVLIRGALGQRHPDVVGVLLDLAGTYHDRGESHAALTHCQQAVISLGRGRGVDRDRLRLAALALLGELLVAHGRYREALTPWRRAVTVARRLGHAELGGALNGLGVVHRHLGRLDAAAALYREALAEIRRARPVSALQLASIYHNLGGLEHARERFARGVPLARRAVAARIAALGHDHVDAAADRAALASLLVGCGRLDEAEDHYRQALAVFRKRLGPRHFEVGFNLGNLAAIEHMRGRHGPAARLYGRALAIQETAAGASHPQLALLLSNFATLRRAQDREAEAIALQRRAAAIYAGALGQRHPDAIAARRAITGRDP